MLTVGTLLCSTVLLVFSEQRRLVDQTRTFEGIMFVVFPGDPEEVVIFDWVEMMRYENNQGVVRDAPQILRELEVTEWEPFPLCILFLLHVGKI